MKGIAEILLDVLLVGVSVIWYASWSLYLLSVFTQLSSSTQIPAA